MQQVSVLRGFKCFTNIYKLSSFKSAQESLHCTVFPPLLLPPTPLEIMASRLSTCELENGIIYCCSLFYSILGLFSWLHVCTPQNTPPKMATGKKKKRKKWQVRIITFVLQKRFTEMDGYSPLFFQVRLGGGMPLDSHIRLIRLPSIAVS